jgi:hypothetical protein
MRSRGMARCTYRNTRQIGVQFNQIGNYERFLQLLDDFKRLFPSRHWHQDGWWIIPEVQYEDLKRFCERQGIEIRWVEKRQLPLISESTRSQS